MSSTSTKLRFDGRVAIVTGGAQGMGKEHSMLLGSRGAKVVINDLDEKGAEATVKAIQAEGGKAIAVAGSISERIVIEAIVDAAINTWGRIDILINNAGIDFPKPFTEITDSDFSRFLGVHSERLGFLIFVGHLSDKVASFAAGGIGAAAVALL
ncbi:Peroxisomal multifunctional enzyme type 2 [Fusarium culmorum]|uniref:Peroxisomal multifunctional enzyme type 2 n=1 Tax=Fusarium culmorum TaxID=5516 RepID=A0A2T4GFK2_FUSCU|nr:Peroxisomal multifunctional enzyme type 2 [Fusarium culmorum]